MKASTQSMLIIVATLVVGVLIGGLANAAITSHRMDQLESLRYEEVFVRAAEAVIQPHDEAQRAQIRPVLEQAAARRAALRQQYHDQKSALLDSVRRELAPYLAADQRERLTAWSGKTSSTPPQTTE